MKRVYVAGPYSSDNVITILDNIREGMRVSTQVLLAGFAPFCPWLDFHFQLMLRRDEKLSVEDYYNYSLAWLEVSDYMLVVNFRDDSIGTKKEIEFATGKIPIFYNLENLLEFHKSRKKIPPPW